MRVEWLVALGLYLSLIGITMFPGSGPEDTICRRSNGSNVWVPHVSADGTSTAPPVPQSCCPYPPTPLALAFLSCSWYFWKMVCCVLLACLVGLEAQYRAVQLDMVSSSLL